MKSAFSILAVLLTADAGGAKPSLVATYRTVPIQLPALAEPVVLRPKATYKPIIVNPARPPLQLDRWHPVEYVEPHGGYVYHNKDDDREYVIADNATYPVVRQEATIDADGVVDSVDVLRQVDEPTNIVATEDYVRPAHPYLRGVVNGIVSLPGQLLRDSVQIVKGPAQHLLHRDLEALGDCTSLTNPWCVAANTWGTFAAAARMGGVIDVFSVADEGTSFLAGVNRALVGRVKAEPRYEVVQEPRYDVEPLDPVVGIVADEEVKEVVAVYRPDCKVDELVRIPGEVANRILEHIDAGRRYILGQYEEVSKVVNKPELAAALTEPLDYLSQQVKQWVTESDKKAALEDAVDTLNAGADKVEIALSHAINSLTQFPVEIIRRIKDHCHHYHRQEGVVVTTTPKPILYGWFDNTNVLVGSGTPLGRTGDVLRDTADQLMSIVPKTLAIAPSTAAVDTFIKPLLSNFSPF